MNNCAGCEELTQKISSLQQELSAIRDRLDWLRTHATLARGLAGEKLIANKTGGVLTIHTASSDVVLPSGARIEVKSAKRSGADRKWQWNKILGQSGTKEFDYLVLIGEADQRCASRYRFPGPEILFLVPRADVAGLCGGRDRDGTLKISLTPNPATARGCAARLFDYQADPVALERALASAV